jgi:hypothetical protein
MKDEVAAWKEVTSSVRGRKGQRPKVPAESIANAAPELAQEEGDLELGYPPSLHSPANIALAADEEEESKTYVIADKNEDLIVHEDVAHL